MASEDLAAVDKWEGNGTELLKMASPVVFGSDSREALTRSSRGHGAALSSSLWLGGICVYYAALEKRSALY